MPGVGHQRGLHAQHAALVVVAGLDVDDKAVAPAGDHEVVVAVQPQLDRALQPLRRHRGDAGDGRRLRFLAAEAAAHAPAFHAHRMGRPPQRMRHHGLHLAGVLGRTPQLQAAAFGRCCVGDLAFEVEVFLAADVQPCVQALRCRGDGRGRVASHQVHGRQHMLAGFVRGPGVQQRGQRLGLDDVACAGGRAPCLFAGVRHHHEHRLPQVAQRGAGLASQDGVVVHQRAAFVGPRDARGGEHVHHAGQRAQRVQVHRLQHTMRQRRQAQGRVQRAGQFGQVVGVGRAPAHVQRGRLVRVGHAHHGRLRGAVHHRVSTWRTSSCAAASGASGLVSSHRRRNRLPATCSR
jgi:hypothetical protein